MPLTRMPTGAFLVEDIRGGIMPRFFSRLRDGIAACNGLRSTFAVIRASAASACCPLAAAAALWITGNVNMGNGELS